MTTPDRLALIADRAEALKDRKRATIRTQEMAIEQQVELANAAMGDVRVAIEAIAPAKAVAYLGKSTGNRKLRQKHVEWLAEQMKAGRWRVSHQGLAFSRDGRLLDGHHRLNAVKLAGVEVPMLVIRGLPEDAWGVIDCGAVRMAHDRMTIATDQRQNVRFVALVNAIYDVEHYGKRAVKPCTDDLQEIHKRLGGSVDAIMGVFATYLRGIARSHVLAAMVQYHARMPKKALEFAIQVRDGANLSANAPALTLRNALMTNTQIPRGDLYWKTVSAARAHRDGRSYAQLVCAESWGWAA